MQTSQPRPEDADEQEQPTITRSVEIDADTESVWETIATDEGRQRWIEPDPDRVLIVEREEAPSRISWWWWSAEEAPSYVDIEIVGIPAGTRVTITEVGPASFPVAEMSAACGRQLVVA